MCSIDVLDPHGLCTTYDHRFNFDVKHNGKGIHNNNKDWEPSHWQLFHFHSTLRVWNDNVQVDHTWSLPIPSHVRQSTIRSTRPKKLFVGLEVPTIGPHALDEIANWFEIHFMRKHSKLVWESMHGLWAWSWAWTDMHMASKHRHGYKDAWVHKVWFIQDINSYA